MKSLNWMQKGGSLFFEREAEDIFNVTRKFSCILHSSGTLSSIKPGKGRDILLLRQEAGNPVCKSFYPLPQELS